MKRSLILLAWCGALGCTGAIEPLPGRGEEPAAGGAGASIPNTPGGGTGGQRPDVTPAACAPPAARIWKLTPEQYARTLATIAPSVADAVTTELGQSVVKRKHAFSNPASAQDLSEPYVGKLFELAQTAVDAALADPAKLAPCLATKASDAACIREMATAVATKAFRRPVTTAEAEGFVTFWRAQPDTAVATKLLLQWIVMSSDALFRTEIGGPPAFGKTQLTADERASALSFFLTDGPPDAQLLAAAAAGKLATSAGMRTEAERLIATPAAAAGVRKLLAELYGLREAPLLRKDAAVFAAFTPKLAADMTREGDLFVEEVLWKADARLGTLLTANFGVVNGTLAAFYGVDAKPDAPFARITLPATRRGLLTLPGLMSRLARENDTDPVARGKFVREVLLCQELPALPGNLNVIPPPPDGKRTQRERLAAHSVGDCAPCHKLMDPIGLAFEHYDGIGKYRTTEAGKTIDPSGTLTSVEPADAPFANAVELAELLARSPEVTGCFVRRAFEYAHGRAPGDADECAIRDVTAAFDAKGGNVLSLMVTLAGHASFVERAAGGSP